MRKSKVSDQRQAQLLDSPWLTLPSPSIARVLREPATMGVWPKVRPEKRMPSMASTTYTGTRDGTGLSALKIAAMLKMGDSDCRTSSKLANPCTCTGQGRVVWVVWSAG